MRGIEEQKMDSHRGEGQTGVGERCEECQTQIPIAFGTWSDIYNKNRQKVTHSEEQQQSTELQQDQPKVATPPAPIFVQLSTVAQHHTRVYFHASMRAATPSHSPVVQPNPASTP